MVVSQKVTTSVWADSAPSTDYPRLDKHTKADVANVGAGITGLTTAIFLQQAGLSVAVLDSKRVTNGVSGFSGGGLF